MLSNNIKIKICQKHLARKFTLFEQNALQQCRFRANVFFKKMICPKRDIQQNVLGPKPGNLCATVPISVKRVFWEWVSPNLGHPTECFHRNICVDVPKTVKRVFGKWVSPNLGHQHVVKAGPKGSDVIAKSIWKIKNWKHLRSDSMCFSASSY